MARRRTRRNDHRISFRQRAERVAGSRATAETMGFVSKVAIAFVGYKIYKWWTGT